MCGEIIVLHQLQPPTKKLDPTMISPYTISYL